MILLGPMTLYCIPSYLFPYGLYTVWNKVLDYTFLSKCHGLIVARIAQTFSSYSNQIHVITRFKRYVLWPLRRGQDGDWQSNKPLWEAGWWGTVIGLGHLFLYAQQETPCHHQHCHQWTTNSQKPIIYNIEHANL